jgi:EAL domain-containing protein (putative c-di-GMP-specific phosphodiesterase class I)/CheY-like chemotaxis protein
VTEHGVSVDGSETILIVDDDPDLRSLISIALHRAGFETHVADSGDAALALLERQTVDAVVLDMGMPGLSGIDVIKTLRSRTDTGTLPILMMTGSGTADTVLEALAAGADDFLAKPVRFDELVARIRAHRRTTVAWTDKEAFDLRARADVVAALAALPISTEPYDAAAAVVSEIGTAVDCDFVGVLQIGDPGRLTVLASHNKLSGVERGGTLSKSRSRYLLSRLRDGPWVEVVGSRASDDSLNASWMPGVELVAGAPIYAGHRVVGLLITGYTAEAGSSPARRGRLLAAVIDYANILSAAAGPAIAHQTHMSATRARVRRIIDGQEFYIVYQPILDLSERRIVGYEALTRFGDGTPPDVHFAEAIEFGLGLDLETAVIESALIGAKVLPVSGSLSLNASPSLVLDHGRLSALLDRATTPVILEVTEHARIEDYDRLRSAIASYGPGVRVAIDDAGAGYSSLRHILELRPAFVKLDISIVQGIDVDPVRQALVSRLVYFAGKTGFELIAEGIEVEAEADILEALGISLGQGYLFGPPTRVA